MIENSHRYYKYLIVYHVTNQGLSHLVGQNVHSVKRINDFDDLLVFERMMLEQHLEDVPNDIPESVQSTVSSLVQIGKPTLWGHIQNFFSPIRGAQ